MRAAWELRFLTGYYNGTSTTYNITVTSKACSPCEVIYLAKSLSHVGRDIHILDVCRGCSREQTKIL